MACAQCLATDVHDVVRHDKWWPKRDAIRTTWINLKGSHTASYADSVDGSRGVARRSRLARVRAGLTGAAREISGRRRVRPRLTFSKYLARRLGSKRRLGSLVQFLHQAVWSGVVLPILAAVESDLRLLPLLLLLPAAGQDHAAVGGRANHFRGVRICAARPPCVGFHKTRPSTGRNDRLHHVRPRRGDQRGCPHGSVNMARRWSGGSERGLYRRLHCGHAGDRSTAGELETHRLYRTARHRLSVGVGLCRVRQHDPSLP